MSDEANERAMLVQTITAWREARDASEPGSPEYLEIQNKMKEAEWQLQRLGQPPRK